MTRYRSFVAIDCPDNMKESLIQVQQELKECLAGSPWKIRWVRPAALHLTLKFLGEVEQSQSSTIVEVLQQSVQPLSPFTVYVGGGGVFPSVRSPSVLWVGIHSEGEELRRLQERVEEGLVSLGFAPEARLFHSHLTLGRVKSARPTARDMKGARPALEKWLAENEEKNLGCFQINEVLLMRSDLQAGGVEYSPLACMELTG